MRVSFASPLVSVNYLHVRILKKKVPEMSLMMAILKWGCCFGRCEAIDCP